MIRLSKLGLVSVAFAMAFAFPAYSWEPLQPNTIKSATFNDGDIYTVWHRIRDGFGVPDMNNAVVDEQIAFYKSKPDYLQRMANRSAFYLYHIIEEVQAQNMPTEIALLPFVESAFVTKAKSRVKAAGLWQFMPSTGKIFSLDQNLWKDERNDVLQSTTAALKYLKKLYAEFGDWQLALAGYNWGEGNIRKQIKKNQNLGLPTDYMSLTMPEETRKYYPKLQAIKDIVLNPQKYGVKLPLIYDEPFLVQIYKEQDIDISTAAKLAKMNEDDFNTLNPSFNRPVIVASHNNYMLLPTDRIDGFVENLVAWRTSGKPLSSWTTYRVKPGDTIASIAQKANMTEGELRRANQIPDGRRVNAGSLLLVSRSSGLGEAADISSDTINAEFSLAAESRRVSYRVRKGDTLPSIAKRLGTSQKAIIANNRLKGSKVHPGQTLVVNVPVKNRQTASTTPAKTSTKFYVVRPGDTVFSIARRFDVDASALRSANGMKDNHLQVGQRLSISKDGRPIKTAVVLEKLPASVQKRVDRRPLASAKSYTVRKGDTLFSIASSANMSVNELKKLNGISGNSVKLGQKLKLR